MKKNLVFIYLFIVYSMVDYAQNVSVNTTGAAAASANMFEVTQTSTTAGKVAISAIHSGATAGTGYGIYASKTGAGTTNIGGYFNASGGTNNYALIVPSDGGRVGIGTSAPAGELEIAGTTQVTAKLKLSGQHFNWGAATSTEGIAFLLGVNLANNRQLWIGESDKLTQNATNATVRIFPNSNGGYSAIDAVATDGSTLLPLVLSPNTDPANVGIGTFYPAALVDLYPRIFTTNTDRKSLKIGIEYNTGSTMTNWYGCYIAAPIGPGVITNKYALVTEAGAGNVGIGISSPAYKLDVCGDVRADGSVYYGGACGTANGTLYTKPDYVFKSDYELLSPAEVEKFIVKKGHLPWLTSAEKEKKENKGAVNLTRMGFETLEAVENMEMQIIELSKHNQMQQEINKGMQNIIKEMQKEIEALKRK